MFIYGPKQKTIHPSIKTFLDTVMSERGNSTRMEALRQVAYVASNIYLE